MSTVTHAGPGTGTEVPQGSRLVSKPLALVFMAEFACLTSFFLLISVLPMLAAAGGASSASAGLINGALLAGTVRLARWARATERACTVRGPRRTASA